jgi:hypothetical protein
VMKDRKHMRDFAERKIAESSGLIYLRAAT